MAALLQDFLTVSAGSAPGRTAIVDGRSRTSYAELEAHSNRIARQLLAIGLEPGDRVALCMRKSASAIAALLGIYKADGVYVPLDPASPVPRLVKMLEACEPRVLLAGGADPALIDELLAALPAPGPALGWFGSRFGGASTPAFTEDDVARCASDGREYANGAGDPAHILFTSGSTGTPKGVVITHSNVIHTIEWAIKHFAIDASDRLSGHFPLHFDLSFFDIFSAAAVGAELHLAPPDLLLPNKLADFIRGAQLTQWFSVPSALAYMTKFNVASFNDFPSLKRMLWCGEVLPTPVLMYWMKRLPHVTFTNLYGPTETTIVSSYYTIPECPTDPQASIPIGVACDGEELLVLNESREPVRSGETGDLHVAGVGLAKGYWRDPERTRAVFVPHPQRPSDRIYKTGDLARVGDDGLVYFLGRSDSQIKSRGYRIELGEIESALNTVDGVEQAAVVALNTGGFEGAVICCAYAPVNGLTPATLRRQLSKLIPAYMLPAKWLVMEQLPTNANGKIDRRRIKDVFEASIDAHAAHSA
jgi:amino acid adenylation domain-containing protein